MIIIIIGFIFFFLITALIYLTYWLPKKLGYPKVGKYTSIILTLLILIKTALYVFEDELFSKTDAEKLLMEQGIQLKDNYKIEENKSDWGVGDYYHTFTLIITPHDKQRIINQIKNASNFSKEEEVITRFDNQERDYNGPKRFTNYETEEQYVRELFEPHGSGYAPTWRKIEIEKKNNKLTFEDIDE
ncbi:hypothetical protein SRABI27_02429 [Pedobacter sp. Bi27]|nr:hypothetical protein SRABI27_02429 [Pedobacter sp. Bi27]CAH0242286.1 hypothetical protein SRABI36_03000 [Pedobacter sp. Bi36]CAH0268174.1 hypothetical protein SRABI126_03400 [Pedobacter sp. Bi126]